MVSESEIVTSKEILDALSELFALMRTEMQKSTGLSGLPPPYAFALMKIDGSAGMKELGHELHCDPSFVTAIADGLEEQGLARREVDPADRRAKNLVLTSKGTALRSKLQREFFDDLPGIRNLDERERRAFVALLRKMV
jgi:DNA-binding MarR family transcriptional regulator